MDLKSTWIRGSEDEEDENEGAEGSHGSHCWRNISELEVDEGDEFN